MSRCTQQKVSWTCTKTDPVDAQGSRSRSLLVVVTLALNTGMRHDEMRLLLWRQVDFVNEAVKVGKSKTEHGAGRSVPLNKAALKALKDWSKDFPDRKPTHYVFPSEKVGFSGNDECLPPDLVALLRQEGPRLRYGDLAEVKDRSRQHGMGARGERFVQVLEGSRAA